MNKPLAPVEAVASALYRVEHYQKMGSCESCALKIVATELGLPDDRLLFFWLDRHLSNDNVANENDTVDG